MVGPITAHKERLRSRRPFVPAARKVFNKSSKLSIRAAQRLDYKWDMKYSEDQSDLLLVLPRPIAKPLGMSLPRPAWVRLNRLCTGVGRFQSFKHK